MNNNWYGNGNGYGNGYGNGNGNTPMMNGISMATNMFNSLSNSQAGLVSYSKDLEKLDASITDLIQYTLKTHFCNKGVLSIDKLEKYLLNMVEQICSDADHTAAVYSKFIKYNISKPFQVI